MNRDELIEKVARAIHAADDIDETYNEMKSFFYYLAQAAIATILAELQEPTEEMIITGGNYVLSVGSIDCMHVDDRPEFGIKGRETGSYELFKAMLAASPLVKK